MNTFIVKFTKKTHIHSLYFQLIPIEFTHINFIAEGRRYTIRHTEYLPTVLTFHKSLNSEVRSRSIRTQTEHKMTLCKNLTKTHQNICSLRPHFTALIILNTVALIVNGLTVVSCFTTFNWTILRQPFDQFLWPWSQGRGICSPIWWIWDIFLFGSAQNILLLHRVHIELWLCSLIKERDQHGGIVRCRDRNKLQGHLQACGIINNYLVKSK